MTKGDKNEENHPLFQPCNWTHYIYGNEIYVYDLKAVAMLLSCRKILNF